MRTIRVLLCYVGRGLRDLENLTSAVPGTCLWSRWSKSFSSLRRNCHLGRGLAKGTGEGGREAKGSRSLARVVRLRGRAVGLYATAGGTGLNPCAYTGNSGSAAWESQHVRGDAHAPLYKLVTPFTSGPSVGCA